MSLEKKNRKIRARILQNPLFRSIVPSAAHNRTSAKPNKTLKDRIIRDRLSTLSLSFLLFNSAREKLQLKLPNKRSLTLSFSSHYRSVPHLLYAAIRSPNTISWFYKICRNRILLRQKIQIYRGLYSCEQRSESHIETKPKKHIRTSDCIYLAILLWWRARHLSQDI